MDFSKLVRISDGKKFQYHIKPQETVNYRERVEYFFKKDIIKSVRDIEDIIWGYSPKLDSKLHNSYGFASMDVSINTDSDWFTLFLLLDRDRNKTDINSIKYAIRFIPDKELPSNISGLGTTELITSFDELYYPANKDLLEKQAFETLEGMPEYAEDPEGYKDAVDKALGHSFVTNSSGRIIFQKVDRISEDDIRYMYEKYKKKAEEDEKYYSEYGVSGKYNKVTNDILEAVKQEYQHLDFSKLVELYKKCRSLSGHPFVESHHSEILAYLFHRMFRLPKPSEGMDVVERVVGVIKKMNPVEIDECISQQRYKKYLEGLFDSDKEYSNKILMALIEVTQNYIKEHGVANAFKEIPNLISLTENDSTILFGELGKEYKKNVKDFDID